MNGTLDVKDLLIRTLPTPNPFAIKFVVNSSLKNEGKATFNVPSECEELPLIRDFFTIEGVKQIHVFQNTLTVTHSGELTNEEVSDLGRAILQSRFAVHDPKFGPSETQKRSAVVHTDPTLQQIEEILDRTIRPGLQADGGDVELLGLDGNELSIRYQGACGGCPSAMMGTLDAIQGILRNELGNPQLMVNPEM